MAYENRDWGGEISSRPPVKLVGEIRKQLTVKNSEYQNRARRGLWLGRTPDAELVSGGWGPI